MAKNYEAAKEPKPKETEQTIRLHNKSKRAFQFSNPVEEKEADGSPSLDADGNPILTQEVLYFNPGQTGTFPASVGKKLLRLYPKEIVSLDEVGNDFRMRPDDAPASQPKNDTMAVNKSVPDADPAFGETAAPTGKAPAGLDAAKDGGTIGR